MSDTDSIDVDHYRDELESKRAEKDEFFADHPQSPIPPEERDEFDGLDYFDPDPAYRVSATATAHDDPEVVSMETTAGREMRYLRVVTLEFELEREDERLRRRHVRTRGLPTGESERGAPVRAVPGQDDRPADLRRRSIHGTRVRTGPDDRRRDYRGLQPRVLAVLRLQRETFDCPLPPEENWLEITIPAGERDE